MRIARSIRRTIRTAGSPAATSAWSTCSATIAGCRSSTGLAPPPPRPTTSPALAGAPHLLFSPGRLDPTNAAFAASRKPLAAELTFAGQTLFVIANHFVAKLGDQPLYGRFQPPALGSQAQRVAQANVVGGFVSRVFASNPAAKVIVLGDLNDFSTSPPVLALEASGLTDMIETLPANERYTYVFQGNSQVLDHIMASSSLAPRGTFDVVHVNAEFSDQASDHEPAVTRFDFGTAPVITSVPATTVLAGAAFTYDIDANGTPAPTYALVSGPTSDRPSTPQPASCAGSQTSRRATSRSPCERRTVRRPTPPRASSCR